MKLGYDLTIEQTQKLVMTPELIQAIQILQFNNQELESYVQEQLLVNPVLEQSHEPGDEERESESLADRKASEEDLLNWKDYIRNTKFDDISYNQWRERSSQPEGNSYEQYVTKSDVTLPEHLMFQYQFAAVSKGCRRVGKYIIESLDENGYMTSTVEEIAAATGTTAEKVSEALEIIQGFEPAGVGARDISECLLIQLRNLNALTPQMEDLITNHLSDIADNRLGAVARDMGISVQAVQDMSAIIKTLEPKPGRQFATEMETKYVVPDVLVEKVDDRYVVSVNEHSTPHLMVSSYYSRLLRDAETDEQLAEYLTDRLNSARWLIKSIEQRKDTIYNVVTAVVKYQQDFFDKGSKYLKTLTLKDIAEEVGIHESTVSRSINGKYLQCPRGVFEIKYFFSAGVSDESGEGISSKSIKEFIKELVEDEDERKPLSDQIMVKRLKEKGINISRRTVAKYRDELGILSSSKRRRY